MLKKMVGTALLSTLLVEKTLQEQNLQSQVRILQDVIQEDIYVPPYQDDIVPQGYYQPTWENWAKSDWAPYWEWDQNWTYPELPDGVTRTTIFMKTTDPNMADRSRVSNSFRYWMNTPASFWYLCAPKSFLNRDFQCVKDPKYWKPPSRICNPATYSSVSGYAPSCTNKVDPNKVECCYNEYEAQYFKLEFQSNVTNVDRLINGKKAP